MKTLLEAKSLAVSFSSGAGSRRIFSGIDLTLKEGGFLSILGPSGCGKTTLLKILAGFHHADSGTVTHGGKTVTGPEKQRLMIFQDFQQLFPWMTVLKNTAFPLRFSGLPRPRREALAADYLERVGMAEHLASYPHELSGGMKQRVALARALVTRPDILLMDEPFAGLDAPARKNLRALVTNLWSDLGLSVIFVTHDIEEALVLSETLLLFSRGTAKDYPLELPRPRDESSEAFRNLREDLYSEISSLRG
ncbi:MAG: ABC transporter ATP-binding protein [Spirochaetales bacterium]|nr:ABC transporter ATP-binding protein [Spirochaetales bacterium]